IGSVEEELEALRTALGYAFYKQDQAKMAQLLKTPLFRRLPPVDRKMWSGLLALLTGDKQRFRSFLEEAVYAGYRRAALILAVHAVQGKRVVSVDEAQWFFDKAAKGRTDDKIKRLHKYINLLRNRLKTDSGQGRDASQPTAPELHFANGLFHLRH